MYPLYSIAVINFSMTKSPTNNYRSVRLAGHNISNTASIEPKNLCQLPWSCWHHPLLCVPKVISAEERKKLIRLTWLPLLKLHIHTTLTEFPKLISFRMASHKVLICWMRKEGKYRGREGSRGRKRHRVRFSNRQAPNNDFLPAVFLYL